jgi:hypothetical protein
VNDRRRFSIQLRGLHSHVHGHDRFQLAVALEKIDPLSLGIETLSVPARHPTQAQAETGYRLKPRRSEKRRLEVTFQLG